MMIIKRVDIKIDIIKIIMVTKRKENLSKKIGRVGVIVLPIIFIQQELQLFIQKRRVMDMIQEQGQVVQYIGVFMEIKLFLDLILHQFQEYISQLN